MRLTERAAHVMKIILKESNREESFVRFVAVSGGCSCSGQKYGLYIDDEKKDDDVLFEVEGIKLIVDPVSYQEAKDLTIDYVKDEVFGEGFTVLGNSCGCQDNNCNCKG
ncbi:MAG: HesB/IscA family protein [Brevinematia bacterium]